MYCWSLNDAHARLSFASTITPSMLGHGTEMDQHESNKMRLVELESALDQSSQPHSYAGDLSPVVSPGSPSSAASPGHTPQSGHDSSSSLTSALFHRSKPKKKSKGKGNASTNSSLREQVLEIRNDEAKLIKKHHHSSRDNGDAALEVDEAEVIDLADQLLAQLDAQEEAAARDHHIKASSSHSSSTASVSSQSSTSSASSEHSLSSAIGNIFHHHSPKNDEHKKPNRHRARLQRRNDAAAKAAEDARREWEANGGPDAAEAERQDLIRICNENNVELHEVQPDGHCLFAAVADQLNVQGKSRRKEDYQTLRTATADYMVSHQDDFIAFLALDDNPEKTQSHDGIMTPAEYIEYCKEIRDTALWGGQVEISAMSQVYKTPINIYQAFNPVSVVGEEFGQVEPLRLSYHRHMYGLGEHYNSLRKLH